MLRRCRIAGERAASRRTLKSLLPQGMGGRRSHRRLVVPAVTVGWNLGRAMRAGTRRRLRLIAKVIIFGTLVRAAYRIARHLTGYAAPRDGALTGAPDGLLIS